MKKRIKILKYISHKLGEMIDGNKRGLAEMQSGQSYVRGYIKGLSDANNIIADIIKSEEETPEHEVQKSSRRIFLDAGH